MMEMMILAMTMLFSGLVRGGFAVLLLTFSYYMICSGLPVVRETVESRLGDMALQSALPKILKMLTLIFPSFDRLDFKDFTVMTDGFGNHLALVTSFLVSFFYMVVVLWVACVVYSKRELQ